MDEPARTEWQIRCAFNGFCTRALKHEAINAHRDTGRQQLREVTFSDLTPQEENELYTLDTYFENEAADAFQVGGEENHNKADCRRVTQLAGGQTQGRYAVLLFPKE
jgi:DNA-directed RNA polymerase specialized sigma24 family protein